MSTPAQISFVSNSQSASVNQQLAAPLSVKVVDANGNPISGVTVTFTQGTQADKNAGVSFAGGVNTAVTNGSGIATSPAMTAWGTPGAVLLQAWAGTPNTAVPVANTMIVISLAGESFPSSQTSISTAWTTAKAQLAQLVTDLSTVATDLQNLEASMDTFYSLGAGDVVDWLVFAIQTSRLGYSPRVSTVRGVALPASVEVQAVSSAPRDLTAAAQAPISSTTTGKTCNLS